MTLSTLDLSGSWPCTLDRADAGLDARWFERPLLEPLAAVLPGSLAAQRIGDDVTPDTAWTGTIFDRSFFASPEWAGYREPGNLKLPFWLQPEKTYVGPAWFQREVAVPADWAGRRVVLTLERPHGQTRVWLDDRDLGAQDSLSTPHVYELGAGVAPGTHRLTLRIDNRLHVAVGENAHSVSDHTQGNWNGVVGALTLHVTSPVWIDDLQVYPHVASHSVAIRGTVRSVGGHALPPAVVLRVEETHLSLEAPLAADGTFSGNLVFGPGAALWDEFTPALHRITADIPNFQRTVTFGLRELTTQGTQFLLNGRPAFLRGTLDCCVYPLTGHPPTDVDSWRSLLRTILSHGLNHVRFHSWCPPEAAFIAGDELGVYFQVEASTWPNAAAVLAFNSPAGIGDGASVDTWVFAETERILRAYGNHPCFLLMASGNEPGGPHHREFLAGWTKHFRSRDARRLYTAASGWPELPENQFHVIPEPRGHQWGDNLRCRLNGHAPATTADYRQAIAKRTVPVVAHEIGQWCAYPPVYDALRYTGHLHARNYEIFAASLAEHHLADRSHDFVRASGKLQALCYKEEIEAALRTPGMGGFQLLGLHDFPGQGTAPVGVLDVFGHSKGYISPEAFRRFCSPTVPLARLERRVFTTEDNIAAEIDVAHFGAGPIPVALVSWSLINDAGRPVLGGQLPLRDLPLGGPHPFGRITVPLAHLPAPAHYQLIVRINDTPFENDWDVWVYPPKTLINAPSRITLTRSLADAQAALAEGERVLWLVPPAEVHGDVALGMTPVFWNTWCTQRQAPHTLGLLCDPVHPAFATFPTDAHSNWQWWYLVGRAAPMILDELPPSLRPVVQVIDDWFTNRRLGLVFEARVGRGSLLACSVDLDTDLAGDPVARQFRASLLHYAASDVFAPTHEIAPASLASLLKPRARPASLSYIR
ncbi:MAG TPA: hypothetical protein VGD81_10360 [Opitutaceae bacterium]